MYIYSNRVSWATPLLSLSYAYWEGDMKLEISVLKYFEGCRVFMLTSTYRLVTSAVSLRNSSEVCCCCCAGRGEQSGFTQETKRGAGCRWCGGRGLARWVCFFLNEEADRWSSHSGGDRCAAYIHRDSAVGTLRLYVTWTAASAHLDFLQRLLFVCGVGRRSGERERILMRSLVRTSNQKHQLW